MGDLTKNFSNYEFDCPCCGKLGIKHKLVLIAQATRDIYGQRVIINSGVRCHAHNLEEGGKPNSDHLTGDGIDIHCTTSRLRYHILRSAIEAGVNRIGIGSNFIHLGISDDNPQQVVWTYL